MSSPTFKTMRMRLEDRENSDFLKVKLALEDSGSSPRSRTDLLRARREDNASQLEARWGEDGSGGGVHSHIAPMAWHTAKSSKPELVMQRSLGATFWQVKDGFDPAPAQQSNRMLRESRKWYKKMELNLGPVTKPEQAWGQGGPCDPYQRPRKREPGVRDGFSRKDPEVDGLGSGIKITQGVNIGQIQECLTERSSQREQQQQTKPYWKYGAHTARYSKAYCPEIHHAVQPKKHIFGSPQHGRNLDLNNLTAHAVKALETAEATRPVFSSFSALHSRQVPRAG